MLMKLQHIAIIMDGNGRWAQMRDKPRTFGHVKGVRVAKQIITHAADLGLKNLTLYAFSSENWLRPQTEVMLLMTLLERYLKKESENLHKKNIRFDVIGDTSKLPSHIQSSINRTKELTKNNTGLHVSFALSYGSRQELVLAAQTLARKVQTGELTIDQINETSIADSLMTAGTPDPDLVIRTSGEARLSNFLLWQASYSELYFTQTLWPDFTAEDFNTAITHYLGRERRFGKVLPKNDESFV